MLNMELDLIIDILMLVVPTIIALISLAYVMKQRSVVKEELSKKRYLENAQSNLNEAIKSLRQVGMPNIRDIHEGYETFGDVYNDFMMVLGEILRANFNLKRKEIHLEVSYELRDLGERSKLSSGSETKEITNFENLDPQWFINFSRTHTFYVNCYPRIRDFEQVWNVMLSSHADWNLGLLAEAMDTLLNYEEVYETVSPDSVKKVKRVFEEISTDMFNVFRKPKSIDVDLSRFSETDEILICLFEQILNYSHIAEKFSQVTDLIDELVEIRKELFLKIS